MFRHTIISAGTRGAIASVSRRLAIKPYTITRDQWDGPSDDWPPLEIPHDDHLVMAIVGAPVTSADVSHLINLWVMDGHRLRLVNGDTESLPYCPGLTFWSDMS